MKVDHAEAQQPMSRSEMLNMTRLSRAISLVILALSYWHSHEEASAGIPGYGL